MPIINLSDLNITGSYLKATETAQGCKISDLSIIHSYCANYGLKLPFMAVLAATAALLLYDSPRLPEQARKIILFIALALNMGALSYFGYMLWFYKGGL